MTLYDEAARAYPAANWECQVGSSTVDDGAWQIERNDMGAYVATYYGAGREVRECRLSLVAAVEAAAKRAIDPMTGRLGVALPGHDQ